jgi:hypothetical protein
MGQLALSRSALPALRVGFHPVTTVPVLSDGAVVSTFGGDGLAM